MDHSVQRKQWKMHGTVKKNLTIQVKVDLNRILNDWCFGKGKLYLNVLMINIQLQIQVCRFLLNEGNMSDSYIVISSTVRNALKALQVRSSCHANSGKKALVTFHYTAVLIKGTPLKFNIAPEKWWLDYYFPIGKVTFQGLC